MSENFKQYFLPPHYTPAYYGGPSVYHEPATNTYDYYYHIPVSQDQWLYGRDSGQPSYSPSMSYYKQAQETPLQYQRAQHTQWQQYESPHRHVNSYTDYSYSNLLQQQGRALREQIAYEQANSQQFSTNPYIISSDGQQMRNRLSSRRLVRKPAPEHIVGSGNPEDGIISPAYHMIIDFREHAGPSKPSKPVSSILTESPVTNRDSSSDSEEVSGAKPTGISKILGRVKRQARSEAGYDTGLNPFRKATRRNKSYAKEQLREAEITINESIPTTLETGNMETAKDAFWKIMISKFIGYLSDREKVNQVEIITFFSEQVNQFIDLKSLSTLLASIDHAYGITGYLSPCSGWYLDKPSIPNLDFIWVVVPTVCGTKWCEKFSSKQPFEF